ncbi:unnamed protein product [marine sediment metagenome]|uniref:Uncharacterized protein n=1 Tax=marine sediment metagenome TaxID=412755 RepID=X1T638_9ZZZZ
MDTSDDFLIGGDELFQEPRFVKHYKFMIDDYIPNVEKPIAFFLSCSKHKPYNKSPYRRVSLLWRLSVRNAWFKADIITFSELFPFLLFS